VNALGTYGVLGRNNFIGPGSLNLDLGLHKDFPVNERAKFQFRFEAFNVFNNVNLSNPNSTVTSGNFMKITSTATDRRILQFAFRSNRANIRVSRRRSSSLANDGSDHDRMFQKTRHDVGF
jgi:hypothetical protein